MHSQVVQVSSRLWISGSTLTGGGGDAAPELYLDPDGLLPEASAIAACEFGVVFFAGGPESRYALKRGVKALASQHPWLIRSAPVVATLQQSWLIRAAPPMEFTS